MDQSNQASSSPVFSPIDPVQVVADSAQLSINQDQNNSNQSQQNPLVPNTVLSNQNTSAIPFSQPGQAASPSFDAQVVAAPQEVAAIPKEAIGFSQADLPQVEPAPQIMDEPSPNAALGSVPVPLPESVPSPVSSPGPQFEPEPEPELEPESKPMPVLTTDLGAPATPSRPNLADILPPRVPVSTDDPLPAGSPKPPAASTSSVPPQASGVAADKPTGDGEKSPLEILEEILAEANTEQSKEEDAKKKKEREDREFAEQLAAKEAAFQQQAAIEIDQKRQEVEAAKLRRDDVEADLKAQGRGDDNAPDVNDDSLAIRQLGHDKVQQS